MLRAHSRERRRFPRSHEMIPVRLTFDGEGRQFEATVYTADISLSGVFFATEFFLRVGTVLDLEFAMPNDERTVRIRGVIVREVHLDAWSPVNRLGVPSGSVSGFAMRFVEYHADAKIVLASAFLTHNLTEFVEDYLARRSGKPSREIDQLKDILIAWELGKMELQEGEVDVIRGGLQDSAGQGFPSLTEP